MESVLEKVSPLLELVAAKVDAAAVWLASLIPRNLGLNRELPLYRQAGCEASSYPFLELIVAFTTLCWLGELYLDVRQHAKLKLTEPPETLTTVVSEIDQRRNRQGDTDKGEQSMLDKVLSKFNASRSYQLDRSNFGFVESVVHQFEAVLLIALGYMPFVWDVSGRLASRWGVGESEVAVSLLFLGINVLYEQFLNLPFALYSTFVIEQRHGFNKQTLGLFFADKLKSMLLSSVIGAPIISAVILVIKWGGPRFYIYLWALVFAFSIIMISVYPTLIAPLFNKFQPLDDPDLRAKIEALASKVKFPLTKIFVVDGSRRSAHSNAYMYGFGKDKRIVIFDTLLKQVREPELEAILGHELGHWDRSHVMKMFGVSQVHLFTAFYLFGQLMGSRSLYASFGFASQPTLIGLFLFFQTVWAPIDKVLGFLITAWTRYNEFEADRYATDLGYGAELQTGLVKLQIENLSNMNPDYWYSTYHYSHPPLVERLTAISERMRKRE